MLKETDVKARITQDLKNKFLIKLKEDGITQSDFFITCIMNYLGIKTIPKELTSRREGVNNDLEKNNRG